mmetsp:Transcript_150870/g.484878  ORF Transcript_150870/g.484878 Transcript_150870/m.484878 type:complete len:250 (-) Transcript_150870:500-1249(-)
MHAAAAAGKDAQRLLEVGLRNLRGLPRTTDAEAEDVNPLGAVPRHGLVAVVVRRGHAVPELTTCRHTSAPLEGALDPQLVIAGVGGFFPLASTLDRRLEHEAGIPEELSACAPFGVHLVHLLRVQHTEHLRVGHGGQRPAEPTATPRSVHGLRANTNSPTDGQCPGKHRLLQLLQVPLFAAEVRSRIGAEVQHLDQIQQGILLSIGTRGLLDIQPRERRGLVHGAPFEAEPPQQPPLHGLQGFGPLIAE